MIATIHQPEHLPWLGFFDKIRQADVYVMLDDVPFRKNYFQNRNKIRGHEGPLWLTVPVLLKGHTGQAINEIQINNQGSPRWREKCWASLNQHYRRAPYWSAYEGFFERLYRLEWESLMKMNETIIQYLLEVLSIPVKVVKSSDIGGQGAKGDRLLELCRLVGADVYLSGISGKSYLDLGQFAEAGIEVRFQEFHHPIYEQAYEPFIPCMSAIDLLFNYGPASLDVIKGLEVETMDHVFE